MKLKKQRAGPKGDVEPVKEMYIVDKTKLVLLHLLPFVLGLLACSHQN
jgi:hypothetical protein